MSGTRQVNRPRAYGHGANGRHKPLECAERITFTVFGAEDNARRVLAELVNRCAESDRFKIIAEDLGIADSVPLGTQAYISLYRHGLGSNQIDVVRYIQRAAAAVAVCVLKDATATDLFKGRTRPVQFNASKENIMESFKVETPSPSVLEIPNPPVIATGDDQEDVREVLGGIYQQLGELLDRMPAAA